MTEICILNLDIFRNGNIDNVEVVPMIAEAYKAFNRVYNPNR